MLPALMILWLAWSLSRVCDSDFLQTGDYLGGLLTERIPPPLLPTLVFLIASAVAFATGTSWGTMGLLFPLAVPAAATMGAEDSFLHLIVAAVFSGAVFGDHCSPFSDTTTVPSISCGVEPHDHVRTQMPYALAVGVSGLLLGTLPSGFGLHWSLGLLAGLEPA